MLRYPGKFAKKAERVTGGEQHLERMAASKKPGFRRSVSGINLLDLQKQLSSGFPWKETLRYEESNYISPEDARKWWSMANRAFVGLAKALCEGA